MVMINLWPSQKCQPVLQFKPALHTTSDLNLPTTLLVCGYAGQFAVLPKRWQQQPNIFADYAQTVDVQSSHFPFLCHQLTGVQALKNGSKLSKLFSQKWASTSKITLGPVTSTSMKTPMSISDFAGLMAMGSYGIRSILLGEPSKFAQNLKRSFN